MKALKFFVDPLAAAMAVFWLFVAMPIFSVGLIYGTLIYDKNGIETIIDVLIVAVFYLLDIALYAVSIYCFPQWFSTVKLTPENIIYKTSFHKELAFSYRHFRNVKIASYSHIYGRRYFLVLSSLYLSPSVLMNINQLRCDENTIKIKISKQKCNKLCKILPPVVGQKLNDFCNNKKTDILFDVDKEQKKYYRVQRKKRKK